MKLLIACLLFQLLTSFEAKFQYYKTCEELGGKDVKYLTTECVGTTFMLKYYKSQTCDDEPIQIDSYVLDGSKCLRTPADGNARWVASSKTAFKLKCTDKDNVDIIEEDCAPATNIEKFASDQIMECAKETKKKEQCANDVFAISEYENDSCDNNPFQITYFKSDEKTCFAPGLKYSCAKYDDTEYRRGKPCVAKESVNESPLYFDVRIGQETEDLSTRYTFTQCKKGVASFQYLHKTGGGNYIADGECRVPSQDTFNVDIHNHLRLWCNGNWVRAKICTVAEYNERPTKQQTDSQAKPKFPGASWVEGKGLGAEVGEPSAKTGSAFEIFTIAVLIVQLLWL